MATKPQDNYAILQIGYNEFALPMADALAVMQLMAKAEKYDTAWVDNLRKPYIGGRGADVKVEMLYAEDYLAGKLNGQKEN